jgi:RNA polymerase sigma factor (sigma-70 family)
MDSQRGGGKWNDLLEAEAEFRQSLLRLKTEGGSDEEKAGQLLRSPFVLALLKKVTDRNELRTAKGSRTPEYWWEQLRRDDDLREEWRCETFAVLGRRLRAKPDDGCDLGQNVGAFWRMKIVYAAIRAAWNLLGESRFKSRYDPEREERVVPVKCFSESGKEKAHERHEDKRATADLVDMEFRLDVAMLIDGLEDPRQQAVMRLSAMEGYDYPEIAEKLDITFEQVRYAAKKARSGACKFFCVSWVGMGFGGQFLLLCGRRSSKTMAKWFRAAFQPTIGIVHRCDASWIARYTSFNADSALGYCWRFRVNFRITLFTDSITFVV